MSLPSRTPPLFSAEPALLGDQATPDRRDRRHRRGVEGDLGEPDRVGDVAAVEKDAGVGAGDVELDRGRPGDRGDRLRVRDRQSDAAVPGREADRPVHGAGVDVRDAEAGPRAPSPPWTCRRRTVRRSRRPGGSSPAWRLAQPLEAFDLDPQERPPRAGRELRVPDRPDRHALQLRDGMADRLEHPADLPAPPLRQHDLQPGVALFAPGGRRDPLDLAGPGPPPVEKDPPAQLRELRLGRDARDLDLVLLGAAGRGVRDEARDDRRRRSGAGVPRSGRPGGRPA